MKMLVWFALAAAGIGYWWSTQPRQRAGAGGAARMLREDDGKDTAEAIARMMRESH